MRERPVFTYGDDTHVPFERVRPFCRHERAWFFSFDVYIYIYTLYWRHSTTTQLQPPPKPYSLRFLIVWEHIYTLYWRHSTAHSTNTAPFNIECLLPLFLFQHLHKVARQHLLFRVVCHSTTTHSREPLYVSQASRVRE